jgi:HPt (histidine-containing phosphotransfer) domain-containing protein
MIDWDRVQELRDEVGTEEFAEVVDLFLEEVEGVVARLGSDPDPATYEEELHFLKGSALNLGFVDLGRLCQIGESAAASGRTDTVELPPILACYERSRLAFLDGLAQGLAA